MGKEVNRTAAKNIQRTYAEYGELGEYVFLSSLSYLGGRGLRFFLKQNKASGKESPGWAKDVKG